MQNHENLKPYISEINLLRKMLDDKDEEIDLLEHAVDSLVNTIKSHRKNKSLHVNAKHFLTEDK